MTTNQKEAIAKEVERLALISSQNKIAVKADVSSATISHIIGRKKWETINDDLWRKIKVKLRVELDWNTAETANLNKIHDLMVMAKQKSMSIGFSYDAGAGKSHTYKLFERTNQNVIYVECKTYWTKKTYAKALLTACGLDSEGTLDELLERFENRLAELDKPIVIIDQMDKLKDPSMDLFIDFYNDFDGHCGFVLSGVPAFERRMKRGVKNQKSGYFEIWSRIGKKFIPLKAVSLKDVTAICNANGVTDVEMIDEIFKNCEGDLRRVKRDVEKYFLMHHKSE